MEKTEQARLLIDRLDKDRNLTEQEILFLLKTEEEERAGEERSLAAYLFEKSAARSKSVYGNQIFIRGLIEISNFCKNDCYYCGIRCSNNHINRYRLDKKEILECCNAGYKMGFRTFVLQGGEDGYYTDSMMSDIIHNIRTDFPDCAITLSLGEKERKTYKQYFEAGADRYLLRHETANSQHYRKLHPENMSLAHRKSCLYDLKDIGFQVGCGIMVGSPAQTLQTLTEDLMFMKEFQPHMVGIGPFIPHHDTHFAGEKAGTTEQTLFLLGMVRLLLPKVLLPATTALGTLDSKGRERGILAGANVLMPNLSPKTVRKDYMLYDNKLSTGIEGAESKAELEKVIEAIGYQVVKDRGDFKK